jgi:hypothetical protein
LEEGLVSTFSVLKSRAGLHSDHRPIQATLHLRGVVEKKEDPRLHVSEGSKKKWQATFERVFTSTCLEFIDNTEELEQTAGAFFVAAREADREHREARSGHVLANNPWWNTKCSETKRAWVDATRQNKEQCANCYRAARAEAKGAFFTDMLKNLRDPKDLFKKVRATKGRQAKGVRALRVRDKHAAEPKAQAKLLGKTFFPTTRTQLCSLTMDFDPEQRKARAWRQFTKDELKVAVLGTLNSLAAGLSGLGYRMVKWIIEVAGAQLLNLYNACMRMRRHPTCWKQELMAVVPKLSRSRALANTNHRAMKPRCRLKVAASVNDRVCWVSAVPSDQVR